MPGSTRLGSTISRTPAAVTVIAAIAGIVLVAGACAAPSSAPVAAGPLALGNWGGDSAAMIVSDTAMHIHVGCTYGDVSGRIDVGPTGQFDVTGSYMLRAYPITVGPSVPARFVGKVDAAKGGTATITVTVDDTVTHQIVVRGPVTVSLGQTPRLMPCPICRRPIVTKTR